MHTSHDHHTDSGSGCLSRRQMLIFGGAAVGVVATLSTSDLLAQGAKVVGSRYKAKKIAALADLAAGKAIEFEYPAAGMTNVLAKLGEKAGGGVGKDGDIVAFSAICTHMGGPIGADTYKPAYNVLGPCPLHLTTFDLTRHGLVVSGHATQSLPQVMLEIRGKDIWAIGMMGLIFGHDHNPTA